MTTDAAVTPKERSWQACREKRCCSYYSVILTGHDMVRIARRLDLPPSVFTRFAEAPPDASDAFRLDDSGRAYQMILAKQPQSPDGLAACTFLSRLPGGHAICGLGVERPAM